MSDTDRRKVQIEASLDATGVREKERRRYATRVILEKRLGEQPIAASRGE